MLRRCSLHATILRSLLPLLPLLATASLACALTLTSGCYTAPPPPALYAPPTRDEPQARVDLHLEYHASPGPEHAASVTLEGQQVALALVENADEEGIPVAQQAIMVRAGASHWNVGAGFFRTEVRTRMENVTHAERYPCGYGNFNMMCTRNVVRPEQVTGPVRVPLGDCSRTFAHAPQPRGWYRLEFDFLGPNQCALRCWKHLEKPGQEPHLTPCRALGSDENQPTAPRP